MPGSSLNLIPCRRVPCLRRPRISVPGESGIEVKHRHLVIEMAAVNPRSTAFFVTREAEWKCVDGIMTRNETTMLYIYARTVPCQTMKLSLMYMKRKKPRQRHEHGSRPFGGRVVSKSVPPG